MTFWAGDKFKKPERWGFDKSLVAPEWAWLDDTVIFPMWEGGGNTFHRANGRHSASFSSGTPVWSNDAEGPEIDFSGVSASASVDQSALSASFIGNTNFSITIRARAPAYDDGSATFSIKQASDVTASDSLVFYTYDDTADPATNGARVFWNGFQLISENGAGLPLNKHHIFTFSSFSATDHVLFADGKQVGTQSESKTISANTDEINFGSWQSDGTQTYNGQISYVMLHRRAIGLAQHNQIALDPFGPFRMVEEAEWLSVAAAKLSFPPWNAPITHLLAR